MKMAYHLLDCDTLLESNAPNTRMEPTHFARTHEWRLACSSFQFTLRHPLGPRADTLCQYPICRMDVA